MPRRSRRLRRRTGRLRRPSPASTPPSASPETTISASSARLPLEQFSRGAALAARWTQETITAETRAYLDALEPSKTDEEVGLYHASPRDPIWEYVLSPLQAELCLDEQPHRICLIGHSHVALTFSRLPGAMATGETRANDAYVDLARGEWLINPGSVGQPRDGDPRAAWLELDLDGLQRRLPPHGVRHRRRGSRDPGRPAARLARRATHVRPVRPGSTGA